MPHLDWWENLEIQWKNAFNTVFFHHEGTPSVAEIEQLQQSTVLRLAGPRAPYPNMTFELTNLSGLADLPNLEILVVTHHQIKDISVLEQMKKLKSLFLFNNEIEDLNGIEDLVHLEQLYLQFNKIDSIKQVKQLINLKELYVNNNLLASLEGLTDDHSENLTMFFCKPNDGLKQKELIYAENQLGIKCRSL